MQTIRFHITSLSPLLFASNTDDPNMVGTFRYIPATALRGLFATGFIKKENLNTDAHLDETFYKWFIKGGLIFTDAYITSRDEYGQVKPHYPISVSVQQEKRGTQIYDLMFQDEDFDKQTKGIDGYGRIENSVLYKESVKTSLNFHHARNRERGVAEKGLIFNYESIDEGQVFEGLIIGNEDDLKGFLNTFSSGIYYTGKSRNSQYGRIKLEFLDGKPWVKPEEIKPGEVPLRLLSDTIIYNENGFPTTDTSKFQEIVGCKIKKSFIKTTDEEGFVSVWRLKTPSTTCFKAGSCFLIEVKSEDIQRLLELQEKGIGERTNEGFGRFTLSFQKEDKPKEIKSHPQTIEKPTTPIPELAKSNVIKIIQDSLLRDIRGKAIRDVLDATRLPNPSLLGRLELKVRDLAEIEGFPSKLKSLKNTARNQLESCHVNDKTLYFHLEGFKIENELESILRNNDKLQRLCREVQYKPVADTESTVNLYKEYLQTFFSIMRKKAKEER